MNQLSGEKPTEACSIPCEPITISQCASQSYSNTGFPNFFNQTNQTTAATIAHNIDIAIAANCSEQSRNFLCGLLLPECRENQGLVLPNRQTCEDFYAGCEEILRATGNEELVLDCNVYFSENPEPDCSAQPEEEKTAMPTIDSTKGQYLLFKSSMYEIGKVQ